MKSNTLTAGRERHRWWRAAWAVAGLCAVGCGTCGDATASDLMGPRPTAPQAFPTERPLAKALQRPVIDGAVIRASGDGVHHPSHQACRECGGVCRDGGCPAHCPTRPDTFGFYSTQWRTWPGAGVVQAANVEAFTPATPPRSEVPGADQEARAAAPEEMPLPEEALAPEPTPLPAPAARPMPADPDREAAPREQPEESAPEIPAEKPAPQEPGPLDEENLFDEAVRRLPRTQLLAQLQADAARQAETRRRAMAEQRPVRRELPSVMQATHEAVEDSAESRRINPLR